MLKWLWCNLSSSLLRSDTACILGARSTQGHPVHDETAALDIVNHERSKCPSQTRHKINIEAQLFVACIVLSCMLLCSSCLFLINNISSIAGILSKNNVRRSYPHAKVGACVTGGGFRLLHLLKLTLRRRIGLAYRNQKPELVTSLRETAIHVDVNSTSDASPRPGHTGLK